MSSGSPILRRVLLHTRIVDQDVYRSQRLDRAPEHGDHLLFNRNIGMDRDAAALGTNDGIDNSQRSLLVAPQVVDGDICPRLGPSAIAMALPIPELAPVTRAVYPLEGRGPGTWEVRASGSHSGLSTWLFLLFCERAGSPIRRPRCAHRRAAA